MAALFYPLLAVALCALLLCRFVRTVRGPPSLHRRKGHPPLSVCVVLGSGGHTSEMMRAIRCLSTDMWRATRPFYVTSATDTHSAKVAKEFENTQFRRFCRLHTIPRAREVGQCYMTSIFTTLYAFLASLGVIVTERPDVILVNGPGVCVPVVLASIFLASVSPVRYYCRPSIVYMESFTCVSHLSMSGRLLAPLCDVWTVQWQKLCDACRRKRWGGYGRLFNVGPPSTFSGDAPPLVLEPHSLTQQHGDSVALVTVGSTQFNALIEAVDSEEVCRVLALRGITRLLIQQGTSSSKVRLRSSHGVAVEVFDYKPNLHEIIRSAALVISHAGAGTILEALEYRRPLVVVPNRALMSDHQLELAEALATAKYLFCLHIDQFAEQLSLLDWNTLRVFSGMNEVVLREALRPLLGISA